MIPKQAKSGNLLCRGIRVNLPQIWDEWDVSIPIKLTNSKLKRIFHFHTGYNKKVYSDITGMSPWYLKGLTYTNKNVLLSIIIINSRKSEALQFKVELLCRKTDHLAFGECRKHHTSFPEKGSMPAAVGMAQGQAATAPASP